MKVKVKVTELTVKELKALIQETVEETIEEMLGDPDEGLELREELKERLKRSLAAVKRGEPCIPAEEVARKHGLEW